MSFASKHDHYSEDMFADSRMSFGEHIEDLRTHLLRAIYGFVIALALSFLIGKPVLAFIARPVEDALTAYWERYFKAKMIQLKADLEAGDANLLEHNAPAHFPILMRSAELCKKLGIPEPKGGGDDLGGKPAPDKGPPSGWILLDAYMPNPLVSAANMMALQPLIRRPTLATLRVEEAFMVFIKVCMVTALVLASPWVFYQLWSFVAAGLYPHEKRYVNVYMPFSLGLFLAGVLTCQFLVIPKAVEALLWFNEWLGLEPELRLNDWLGFAILLPLVFGISFQTPLVMLFLERIGIMSVEQFRKFRRIAWFVMAAFAAVVTPTDAFSMIFLWIPMSLLYELGIILCRLQPQRSALDMDVPESEELVEV
jgi:sec-independent protein translocase protein TatC